jgi:hypothetical protein
MAYELHIERISPSNPDDGEEIPLSQWKRAIANTEGVRLRPPGFLSITNPDTGEVVSVPTFDGDADIYFPEEEEWYPVLRWSHGSAHLKAGLYVGDLSHPAWAAAVSLAQALDAVIRGDEGEFYDFETGEVV